MRRQRAPVARIRLRDDVEQQRRISHITRHRPHMRHRAHRRQGPGRHAAKVRLDAGSGGECIGNADRPAAIGADVQWPKTRCQSGARATGRSARGHGEVPRIARDAGQRRIGCAFPAPFGGTGFAENYGTGFAQARGGGGVVGPRLAPINGLRATQGRHAGGQYQILDAGRHAINRRQRRAFGPARL